MPTPESTVVHPLVLLSVVDHYNRVARDTRKRVVGILLGEQSKGRIQVTNSFAGENGVGCFWSLLRIAAGACLLASLINSGAYESNMFPKLHT